MAKRSYLGRIASRVAPAAATVTPPRVLARAADAVPESPVAGAKPRSVVAATVSPIDRPPAPPLAVPHVEPRPAPSRPPDRIDAIARELTVAEPAVVALAGTTPLAKRVIDNPGPIDRRETPSIEPLRPPPSVLSDPASPARDEPPVPPAAIGAAPMLAPPAPAMPRPPANPNTMALLAALDWTSSEDPPSRGLEATAPGTTELVPAPPSRSAPRRGRSFEPAELATRAPSIEPPVTRRESNARPAAAVAPSRESARSVHIGAVHVEIVSPPDPPKPPTHPAPAKPAATSQLARSLTSPLGLRQG